MTLSILQNNSPVVTMSSLEISTLTGKRHDHVVVAIKKLYASVCAEYECRTEFYKDASGRVQPMLVVCKTFSDLILMKFRGLARVPLGLQEDAALKTIEQLLGVTLIRQFRVLSYRVDGYCIASNTVYEIDEPEHKFRTAADIARQKEIESAIGCKFVRISL